MRWYPNRSVPFAIDSLAHVLTCMAFQTLAHLRQGD